MQLGRCSGPRNPVDTVSCVVCNCESVLCLLSLKTASKALGYFALMLAVNLSPGLRAHAWVRHANTGRLLHANETLPTADAFLKRQKAEDGTVRLSVFPLDAYTEPLADRESVHIVPKFTRLTKRFRATYRRKV